MKLQHLKILKKNQINNFSRMLQKSTPKQRSFRSFLKETSQYSSSKIQKSQENESESRVQEVQALKQKIRELQHLVSLQEKEIQHLKEMNKYLELSNQSKLEIIQSERVLKRVTLHSKTIATEYCNDEQLVGSLSPNYRSQNKKLATRLMKATLAPPTANSTTNDEKAHKSSVLHLDREKSGAFNFIQLEETFKLSSVLDPNLSDLEATQLYNSDGTIQLLKQIFKDEEIFIDMMQNAKQQKLSFIYDKLFRILEEHHQLFDILLRFKILTKGAIRMTHSLLLDDALNNIVEQMIKAMQCERATCYILDHEKNELWSRVVKGQHTIIRLPVGQGVAGTVALKQELVNIRNAYLDPRFNSTMDKKTDFKTRSMLVCPVVEGDRCLGVLQCINKKPNLNKGNFSKEDEQIVRFFAEFSAAVLGNAINNDEQNVQTNKLRHIINSVLQFSTQIQDKDRLIRTAQLRILALMNVDTAKICYLSPDKGTMIYFDERGYKRSLPYGSDQGLMGSAIQRKCIQSSGNCYQDSRFNSNIDIKTNLPVVVIPVLNEDQDVVGAIEVIFLKSVSSMIINDELRIGRMDQEILHLFSQILGNFLMIADKVPQLNESKKKIPTIINISDSQDSMEQK